MVLMQDMRFRKPTNITIDPEVMAALDAWIEQQPIKTPRSACIEAAIREFLEKRKGKK